MMPDDDFFPVSDWTEMFKLTSTDDNIVAYIAGYAMKKLNGRFDCKSCSNAFETSSARSQGELYRCDSSHITYIQHKTYDWAKHGLLAPSH